MNQLRDPEGAEEARRLLSALLGAHGAWLVREGRDRAGVELRRGEWELRVAGGGLVLSYWGEAGARSWRVRAWRAEGEALFLEAAGRAGGRRAPLWLVPRASVASAREVLADARRAECERLAALVCRAAGARLERATLSAGARRGEPGRWARILFRRGVARTRFAATAPVVPAGAETAESFLASALLWLARLEEGTGAGVGGLWLVAPRSLAAAVGERVPLLRAGLRTLVSVYELDAEGGLTHTHAPTLEELLEAPAPQPSRPARAAPRAPSELAAAVAALAPAEIDCVYARKGETLRYLGLPFARARRVAGREQLWFGVEGRARRALSDEGCAEDFAKLLADLAAHRRAGAPERDHALYRAAPEAWLEALLRRDVTRLDPGLRLAPLHAQFRAERGAGAARPVDLLALRRDGRLVVVELKVSEDAALALQGADYWRRVYGQHRAGHIARARLFGDAELSEEAPLVYLVAPLLRFHRSFASLARCVRPEIEMYRFDLNEDWRAGVRVARRVTLTNRLTERIP
ncbi:MAG: hypothetical protein LC795_07635 [Acidobacteria bacterium]|nr:hypothetical protein [Acidobacteriota bacterium]